MNGTLRITKVTICVPVYRVEKYIERCARSLFEQTYEDIEYIFVDDCSPDKSIEILCRVLEDYPARKEHVRIIYHDQNKGLSVVRNTAVDYCATEFLMHVDSDDWIDLNVVEACVKNQAETNADIVTFGVKRIVKGKEFLDEREWVDDVREMTKHVIVKKAHNGVWGRLIRTSLYKEYGIKVEAGRGMSEDLQVIPRLLYYSKKATFIGDVFYHYFLGNANSYTASFSFEKFLETRMTYEVLERFFSGKDEELRKAVIYRKVRGLAKNIVRCVKADAGKETYLRLKSFQDNDVLEYGGGLSFPDRMVFYINNYALTKMYVRFASRIKIIILQVVRRFK